MLAHILRARYLSFRDRRRNSDKLFNVFLVTEDMSALYTCVTEYGRRGRPLVRRTIYRGPSRAAADAAFDKKVQAKLFHPETPYSTEEDGKALSELTAEVTTVRIASAKTSSAPKPKPKPPESVRSARMLNGDQFDSLEI